MADYIPFLNYNLPDILPLFGKPSLSTFYMVFIPVGQVGSELADAFNKRKLYNSNDSGFRLEERVSLLCSKAELPGAQFDVIAQTGDRLGVTESFPNFKVFPDVTFSFMCDGNHKIIRLFDEWMSFISPITGDEDDTNSILRFRYPDSYVLDMYVVKFEREEGAWKGNKTFNDGGFTPSYTVSADTTNQALKIDVTGLATTNINHVARVDIIEVKYA